MWAWPRKWCKHAFKRGVNLSSNKRVSTKESQVDLSVREGGCEGGLEGGYMWGIEVLTHLKTVWKSYENELIKSQMFAIVVLKLSTNMV